MKRTVLVEGPLAFKMRRAAAARAGESGLQILTFPQLASRLAGGFLHAATNAELEPAIRDALAQGGYFEIEKVRSLPGMTRAVARTLGRIWEADFDLRPLAAEKTRLADLALLEKRVGSALPPGAVIPSVLRDVSLERIQHAPAVLGPVALEGITRIPAIWRRLLTTLDRIVGVVGLADAIAADESPLKAVRTPVIPTVVACADPRAEVIEALRWTRALLASSNIAPSKIAIATASTGEWDAHFYALAADADLPIHFSHGIPALATRDGQRCAALGDVLLNGLNRDRFVRLWNLAAGEGTSVDQLDRTWVRALSPEATLLDLTQWQATLDAVAAGGDVPDPRAVVLPMLKVLADGPSQAKEAGAMFLRGRSRRLWDDALRAAPPEALELSLQDLRLEDERDPANSVVWCPASHLSAAPRSFVRLLGLTARGWPRHDSEDPILPDHLLSRRVLDPVSLSERDRRAFASIRAGANDALVLSRSRRSVSGQVLAPSPLLDDEPKAQIIARSRVPEHAFSEADRLLARHEDALGISQIASANSCWLAWQRREITRHDGSVRADHPVILRALNRVHSATSLRRMLCDPLGFTWAYALGWRSGPEEEQPLTLGQKDFGELVHELISRTVSALEPEPGLTRAASHEIESTIQATAAMVLQEWPTMRTVPPGILWKHTVDEAAALALRGLTIDVIRHAGTRSWTEVPFGGEQDTRGRDLPWDVGLAVEITGSGIRIRGRIDRLDLSGDGSAVRVTDYKTGVVPPRPEEIVISGGRELQRTLYALACRQLLPDVRTLLARLVYLSSQVPKKAILQEIDESIARVSEFVLAATAQIRSGRCLPRPDLPEDMSDLRIALPANPEAGYFRAKQAAFAKASGSLSPFWRMK